MIKVGRRRLALMAGRSACAALLGVEIWLRAFARSARNGGGAIEVSFNSHGFRGPELTAMPVVHGVRDTLRLVHGPPSAPAWLEEAGASVTSG